MPQTLPPVSVIMAVYNGERYVAEAVESVLRQNHKDFEFIIVNDGSTDRTQAIIEKHAAHDKRIKIINQANADQPVSLNRALAAANNEWVAVLDADDVCVPHRLETQLRALQRLPSVRVLGSFAVWLDPLGREQLGRQREIRALGPTSVAEFEKMVERGDLIIITHPSAMMHRPTILALGGYNPAFGAAADAELWSRVSDEHVVMSLPEPLLYYRFHAGSMSMRRFFEQRLMLRWLQAQQKARRRGLQQPTLESFCRSQGGALTLQRLNHSRKDWGDYLRACSSLAWWRRHLLLTLLARLGALILTPLSTVGQLGIIKRWWFGRVK